MAVEKTRYWVGVCYPENMIDTWEDDISELLQIPYAYCIHDKDLDKEGDKRGTHVHIMMVFSNTTTNKHAYNVLSSLFAPGRVACPFVQPIYSVRRMFDYLIHNTDDCIKKGKFLYPSESRIVGNNFDIGSYEQLSLADKEIIISQITSLIVSNQIVNFADLFIAMSSDPVLSSTEALSILRTNSGYFDRLTRGFYLKYFPKSN